MTALLFLLALAGGSGPSNEAQMAACAWTNASASAATLLARARFDKRYVYDADGSPTVGPLMRIRAACDKESGAFAERSGKALSLFDNRDFLQALKKTRPAQIGADRFDLPVYRCEVHFLDAASGARPAAIIWGYGSKENGRELESSVETLGVQMSPADMAILLSNKDPTEILRRVERIEPVRVTTLAAGTASGKPFTIDLEAGNRTCKHVQPDGSYTDAQG